MGLSTHMDGPNNDHMYIDYNPMYAKIIHKFENFYNNISLFTIEKLSKMTFLDLKCDFFDFSVPVSWLVGGSHGPYLGHSFPILRANLDNNFSLGQMKS